MSPKNTWTETDEIFHLAPMAFIISEERVFENPDAAGKDLKKWANLVKILCEAINEEGRNAPDEMRELVKRQKKKIRTMTNSVSLNGRTPNLPKTIERILDECVLTPK